MSLPEEYRPLEVGQLVTYVFNLVKALQGAKEEDILHFNAEEAKLCFESFITDTIPGSLVIAHNEGSWKLSRSLDAIDDLSSLVVLIKDIGALLQDKKLEDQIQVVNLPNSRTSFEKLRSLVSIGVGQYFDAVTASSKSETIFSTKKKISELILSLKNLDQFIQIPDLSVTLHPKIREAISEGANLDNYTELIDNDTLNDPIFLNSIQTIVNEWVRSIQQVTIMDRAVSEGSAADEINFWISMETSLSAIQEQLDSDGVQLSLEVLKYAKRYHATVSFFSDIQMKEAVERAADYNKLFKDFPLNELLVADNIEKVEEALVSIWTHLKKVRLTSYPVSRSLPLVEAISSDLDSKLKPLLSTLMAKSFQQFTSEMDKLKSLFDTWDRHAKEFTNVARELLRKRGEKFLFVKINSKTAFLKERALEAESFRISHDELLKTLNNGVVDESIIDFAYDAVREVDIFSNTQKWIESKKVYDRRIHDIENGFVESMRNTLDKARNSNEMFQVFDTYRNLLDRPRIRGATQEYQSQLLSIVKAEISQLQDGFTKKSEENSLASLRDYPSVAFTLLWAKQVESKLTFLTDRVELVLGKDWNLFADGQKLFAELSAFKKKLNTKPVFDNWLGTVSETRIEGKVFKLVKDKEISIEVNFDVNSMQLFKEVRALSLQGYQIPHKVVLLSKNINKIYPQAVVLNESLELFPLVLSFIESLQEFKILVSSDRNYIYQLIEKCLDVSWDSLSKAHDLKKIEIQISEHAEEQSLFQLEHEIFELQSKYETLAKYKTRLNLSLEEIKKCKYDFASFSQIISDIQELVDSISFDGFSNVKAFTDWLNNTLRKAFLDRCLMEDPFKQILTHEVVIESAVTVSPALEQTKAEFIAHFQSQLQIIIKQSRIVERSLKDSLVQEVLFQSEELQDVFSHASKFFVDIESHYAMAREFVDLWSQFEALWNFQSEEIYQDLKLDDWLDVLNEVKKSRQTFETNETQRYFGNFLIQYEEAKEKVKSSFASWNKELLQKFSIFLLETIRETHDSIVKAKTFLESKSFSISSVEETIIIVTKVQEFKTLLQETEAKRVNLQLGQTTLMRQRFKFPSDFVYVEQIDSDLETLSGLVTNLTNTIDFQKDIILKNIQIESQLLESAIKQSHSEWNDLKLSTKKNDPQRALESLSIFEQKCTKLDERVQLVVQAATLLSIPVNIAYDSSLVLKEVKDIKSVWVSIQGLWNTLSELKNLRWYDVKPRQLRKELESLLTVTRSMPVRVRQHEPFLMFLKTVTDLSSSQPLVISLKEEHVKDRHLKSLFKSLNKPFRNLLTVGDIWDLNLIHNENLVKSILDQASSEKVLEDTLQGVREYWEQASFELFEFHNQTLVKNLAPLLDQALSDAQSVESMKNSPFYRVFEEEASQWGSKLNKLHQTLDLWIELQRQWIDLDGIFDQKSGIRKLLPNEASRFQMVSNEFMAILKKVYKQSLAIEVLTLGDVREIMARLSESLTRIVKALSEFLEKQRDLFPRFYFVGNDDLLEIIGNMGDFKKITKHLKKMFAGVFDIEIDHDQSLITHIVSIEGETVQLANPVPYNKYSRVDEWLTQLDYEIKFTLSTLVEASLNDLKSGEFATWFTRYPLQVTLLTIQIHWTQLVEDSIQSSSLDECLRTIGNYLETLIQSTNKGKRLEALIIETIHQKNVITTLIESSIKNINEFTWVSQQRFYYDAVNEDRIMRLSVKQISKSFIYGFEYFGVMERLVSTPLLNSCFLAMVGALDQGLGGSPFGPAGTGKTESIKALGQNLGKMVLVFNCDDSFDFQAMGRLLLGICQVGAWGCFDEFNRLDKNILSAVSTQVEQIEISLKCKYDTVELLNRKLNIKADTGLFITMNPTYSGRTTLPDNLKKLFRNFSMRSPDSEIIGEVLLSSQEFRSAKKLSKQTVQFFKDLSFEASSQSHYDFGLRALKSVLANAGKILAGTKFISSDSEILSIVKSINEMISPRLVDGDISAFQTVKNRIFGDIDIPIDEEEFVQQIKEYASNTGLSFSEKWVTKMIQLFRVQENQQGIMIIGKSGRGKTTSWTSLLHVLSKLDNKDSLHYVIDPKVMSKHELFGALDGVTREWSDGLLTSIIRRVADNLRGELDKRVWIIFDGDVDPVWVESLNSVLDDNKLLTLPNGERIQIPSNIKFIFEVDNLSHATPATISRCGMVWFENDMVTQQEYVSHQLWSLCHYPLDTIEEVTGEVLLQHQSRYADTVRSILEKHIGIISEFAMTNLDQVMEIDPVSICHHLFRYLKVYLRKFFTTSLEAESIIPELPESYIIKTLILSLLWAFSGPSNGPDRQKFSSFICELSVFKEFTLETEESDLFDYDVDNKGGWKSIESLLEPSHLGPESVVDPNLVIQTVDTLRHETLVHSLLQERGSLILFGPPGSGKTMTLYAALSRSTDTDVSNLNFSKETTPHMLLRAMEQLCEYERTIDGHILRPKVTGKKVVFFCDEINLPRPDAFGTQTVISFMRQMIEKKGFWRISDKQWISLVNIQFVGACNPPTDTGRTKLPTRALSHFTLVMVDYPGVKSLSHIYDTFSSAVLKKVPQLSGYSKDLTEAMLDVYTKSVEHFTGSQQPHYVYSPRELTRWIRGIYHAVQPVAHFTLDDLVRIWAHEATRLFGDRLVTEADRDFSSSLIDSVAHQRFPGVQHQKSLQRPILFSNWLSMDYEPVDKTEITSFVIERLKVFSEEVMDIDFVLYDDAVDHILRIDRVLKQPQGHLILVGPSSTGKTSLTKFVSWINGFKIVQLGVSRKYSLAEFDIVLKDLLKRSGLNGEHICFIVDESTILDGAFLERMNSLLANSQIQELFDIDEFNMLLNSCKEQVQSRGLLLDDVDELFQWFTQQVAKNLHIVFTINDPNDIKSPQIITSPALFNRCVLNWMGPWSSQTSIQLSSRLLKTTPIDKSDYVAPKSSLYPLFFEIQTYKDALIHAIVFIHKETVTESSSGTILSFVQNFIKALTKKDEELQAAQRRLNSGLDKLKDTVIKVKYLKEELSVKENQLRNKEKEAREMLNKILTEQNEAERKQEASIDLQKTLEEQNVQLEAHRERVLEDLALAEPAVLEARKGVKNIKKQHLTELRSMATPPATVQMTLESVCILLGYQVSSWRDVQSIIRKDDFIFNIVNFDCESQVTIELREFMEETYLKRPDYNFQSADRASKACGPLLQWVEAQVRYSIVLDQVGPLREDMNILEEESRRNEARLLAIDDMITELQDSIEAYKDEYSFLIRDTEKIKAEMKEVQAKVQRSLRLVESLTQERSRWSERAMSYKSEYSGICGNSLLAAAYLSYASSMDHSARARISKLWRNILTSLKIDFDAELSFLDFFSVSPKLLQWQEFGLTNDVLYFENVTIMDHSQKVPFIIDPLGDTISFLEKHLMPRSLVITSFLDDSFVKTLENTMRFGGSILIQDAEYFDPIISRLLNNDFEKIGGRVLVKIGNRDIDLSSNFRLYLHTKDPSVKVSPYVKARTVIIDYTLTESSIETQVVNMTLAHEQPDIEKQRIELVKLNSEYKVKLELLEDDLLSSLSQTKGNLLDNEELISTLETLKVESNEVQQKVIETADVMTKVNDIVALYEPLAKNSSTIFTLLKSLKAIHPFYDFPLTAFNTLFQNALQQSGAVSEGRVNQLIHLLFQEVYSSICFSLLQSDKVLVSLVLAILFLKNNESYLFVDFISGLLKSVDSTGADSKSLRKAFSLLSIQIQQDDLDRLSSYSDTSKITKELESLYNVSLSGSSFIINSLFSKESIHTLQNGFEAISNFLFTGTGPYSTKYNLKDLILATPGKPTILASTRGFDATFKVRNLAEELKVPVKIISMGSIEANRIAQSELDRVSKEGGWLVLQNVQTSSSWLELLEKRLDGLASNEKFRLFLTCDITSEIPTTLLRVSKVFVFENPPGLKTVVSEYQTLSVEKWESSKPVEKRHIYFLLCWFHAVIQERGRFVPIGFSKNYDFNDSDFESAVFMIDKWFQHIGQGRDNISPESIQWDAIQKLVGDIIYGGKVDDENDLNYLHKLSSKIFKLESFNHDFNLIDNKITRKSKKTLSPPEGRTVPEYSSWISSLPDIEPPSWIGLEENADLLLKSKEVSEISGKAVELLESLKNTS